MEGVKKTVFLRACSTGSVEDVTRALQGCRRDEVANWKDRFGRNALFIAAHHSKPEVVLFLKQAIPNLDPNARDETGKTPLHMALSPRMVQVLGEVGATALVKDNAGRSPFHTAAVQKKGAEMVRLLSKKPFVDQGLVLMAGDEEGMTPVHAAVSSFPVLRQLISAYEMRLKGQRSKLLRALEQQDRRGRSPLLLSLKHGNLRAVRLLRHYGVQLPPNALSIATAKGHLNCVEWLLEEEKVDPNAFVDIGPPLLLAVKNYPRLSSKELCVHLVRHGASPVHVGKQGETPLFIACRELLVDIVTLFLKHIPKLGKDPCQTDVTSLMIACASSRLHVIRGIECVELLLRHGAAVDEQRVHGVTCFHIASGMGCSGVLHILLRHSKKACSIVTDQGCSPLHVAAMALSQVSTSSLVACVDMLLRAGLDVLTPNHSNLTPLGIAARFAPPLIFQQMLQCAKGPATSEDIKWASLYVLPMPRSPWRRRRLGSVDEEALIVPTVDILCMVMSQRCCMNAEVDWVEMERKCRWSRAAGDRVRDLGRLGSRPSLEVLEDAAERRSPLLRLLLAFPSQAVDPSGSISGAQECALLAAAQRGQWPSVEMLLAVGAPGARAALEAARVWGTKPDASDEALDVVEALEQIALDGVHLWGHARGERVPRLQFQCARVAVGCIPSEKWTVLPSTVRVGLENWPLWFR